MGRWGPFLFQSDTELDAIGDMERAVVLDALKPTYLMEMENDETSQPMDHCSQSPPDQTKVEDKEAYELGIALLNPLYPRLVRDHLNNEKLATVLTDMRMQKRYYELCLLSACAMQLGCHLPDGFVQYLRRVYWRAGMFEEEVAQLKEALTIYEDGVPYVFKSKGLIETANTGTLEVQEGEIEYPDLEDTDTLEDVARRSTPKTLPYDFNHPVDTCGNCGRLHNKFNERLKRCARCKCRLYCSRTCQKFHWYSHFRACDEIKPVDKDAAEKQ